MLRANKGTSTSACDGRWKVAGPCFGRQYSAGNRGVWRSWASDEIKKFTGNQLRFHGTSFSHALPVTIGHVASIRRPCTRTCITTLHRRQSTWSRSKYSNEHNNRIPWIEDKHLACLEWATRLPTQPSLYSRHTISQSSLLMVPQTRLTGPQSLRYPIGGLDARRRQNPSRCISRKWRASHTCRRHGLEGSHQSSWARWRKNARWPNSIVHKCGCEECIRCRRSFG